ncbi:Uncharacterised protein [Brevundimonas diminuta]|uniref:Uncharacterized protein n=1 Tax=Brevundimonas diminuta TaxID=293 RepID=A0A410NTV9_BREDI|nr:hypothetical protein [Brevundimonas diminuta]MBD3571687.1 hypothetical protein [Brevundimonas diminuta]QAT13329.1 hypothetical protein EQG53_02585 [Brevundimonas diminuta]QQB89309.1 hypothetical protein I6H83_02370 [Brevundimonas diminuta]SPU44815.1 Uncharacterised protein [Brevundimonas diminuta]GEC01596.1 hypothetical protein BDI01nite_26600 [Brevundimonas diminuta]
MVERISLAQQHAVNEQRRMGRTDRQAEKIVGLPSGILSRPFIVVDDRDPRPQRGPGISPRTLYRYTLF